MKGFSLKSALAAFGIYLATALICILSLTSCTSSKEITGLYPVKKGEILTLQEPCYFIDCPGVKYLVPTNNPDVKDYIQNSIGIVPPGIKIEFLGTFEETDLVLTRDHTYARILEGQFRNKKFDADYIMREWLK